MAYNAVSQADVEVASNATDSDASRSPSPQSQQRPTFQSLPLDTEHIGGGSYLQPAKAAEDTGFGSLSSMLRSMTSTSYDMVEEDDYEETNPGADRRSDDLRRVIPPLDTTSKPQVQTDSDEPPLRTPITDTPVPLSHPTPDLQSLQGAYVTNVERLERSAERLSSSSADIASEIRKMNLEQKRRSCSSVSNSALQYNTEGYPLRNNISSPQGSTRSASRLAQVSESGNEGHFSASRDLLAPVPADFPDRHSHGAGYEIERPSSAASGDTFQQARALFTDFDGVHFVDKGPDPMRHVSLTRPPLASSSESYKEPQVGDNMVYYPAPVPMMLNLPPRLSQRRDAEREREKRRTQLLSTVAPENRKSAPWLSGQIQEEANGQKNYKDLPPQLRASVFFDTPAAPLEIEVKQASAVETLESILDASAHAPVTAFTEHPFAGNVGSDVYRSARPKSSHPNLSEQRKKRASRSNLVSEYHASNPDLRAASIASHPLHKQTVADAAVRHEDVALHADDDAYDEQSESDDSETGHEESEEEDEPDFEYTGPPNTLLAELEMRKQELKQRRRTAAVSNGMHSTLLQLEAVAQKQSEHRRQKPVTLAWEDPDIHKHEEDEDEDVPLAVLFPEKANAPDEARPLGLMEKRELEESEPLSRRRARLRGEPLPLTSLDKRPTTIYTQNMPEPAQPDSGDEGETLAQRLKRLKAKDRTSTVAESEFASEILAELSHLHEDEPKDKETEAAPEDETLAQRRERLRREAAAQKKATQAPRYRRSMADILHARPISVGQPPTNEPAAHRGPTHQRSYDNRLSTQQLPLNFGNPAPAGFAQNQGVAAANPQTFGMVHPNTFYSDAILGMNHLSYAMPHNYHSKVLQPVIDNGQREIIDRWRQSIR
ncbi:uncharacterized protein P174DRAFT_432006 [Aspergillus novofumigatus IBT 16806]|uniref:Uncharacterized protein n=1 Tax=Aspergillus novofumigatus (strain IBT 16806) TaxID=1392255 RepID=A0A2I1C4S2_ASPN1|nr:uncharacterized protein P174DRAFT_432006 [Aspergillus novofumigatus IBT 16806]PKX92618.1 hypothetical protein P174DRAFT_432006 [Aspergillus novofumigatus IBT 16806]